jgi:hypothetical protein
MSEIVNLKRHRKRVTREQQERSAAENRRRFGRPKAERERDEVEDARAERHIDGHKRET